MRECIDKHTIFVINEAVEDSIEKISVARSLVDVVKESLESVREKGSAFTGTTVLNVVEVIHRYSREAEEISADVHNKINALKIKESELH